MKQNETILLRIGALFGAVILCAIASVFTMNYFQSSRFVIVDSVEERFSSVAGLDGAVSSLQYIVENIKKPQISDTCLAPCRGILLHGSAGSGKKSLARAVAGETSSPFILVHALEVEKNLQNLFDVARNKAYWSGVDVIVCIDEIDILCKEKATMHQLMKQMDTISRLSSKVVVIGLTHDLDALNESLLRTGRFDQQVAVEDLDVRGRAAVINLYLQKIKHEHIDSSQVALLTQDFSGSDLKDLLAKASSIALRKEMQAISMIEIEEAREGMLLGERSKTKILTDQEREIVAYHESGHALMLLLAPEMNKQLDKITISPRGDGLGITSHLNKNKERIVSRKEMFHDIMYALGGRAAEELIFDLVSTTASSDLEYATSVAKMMTCDYGMTAEFGVVVYTDAHSREIDACIKDIIEGQYKKVLKLLSKNRKKLDLLAGALLEQETLSAEEVYQLLNIRPV